MWQIQIRRSSLAEGYTSALQLLFRWTWLSDLNSSPMIMIILLVKESIQYLTAHIFTYLLTPWTRVLHEKLTVFSYSKNSMHFMEPKGSLPHSQVPATCTILNQLDPIPIPTSHFLKIHLNIILQSTSGSPKWSFSIRFPRKNHVYASPLPHTRYMPHPSHSSLFNHPNNTG